MEEKGDYMCIEFFCKRFCKKQEYESNIPPPNCLDIIDWNEVNTILKAEFPNANILLSDSVYKTSTKDELIRFLSNDLTDSWRYVSEYMDCDDFSYSIMGRLSNPDWGALPFGILWTEVPGGAHAVNVYIDDDREVWILEPQTDELFRLPNDWNPYLVMM